MERLRVLHVFGKLNLNGAETMVMNLYRNIDRSKVQFDFVVHTSEKCDFENEILDLGGRIFRVPRYKVINHIQYKKAWKRLLKEHQEFKVIHGHIRSTASIYLKVARKRGITTIAHSHSTSSGNGITAIVKNILQYPIRYLADYFFACSQEAGTWLFGENVTTSKEFFIVKNAIDTRNFLYDKSVREDIRTKLNIENKYVIGHVGRFTKSKNHILLIDLFKRIHDKQSDTILLLVGDGELRSDIERRVDEMNLTDSVIFTGVRSDVSDILQAMDVFVFPSIYEGLGIAIIEAQVSGLPCVISNSIPQEVFISDHIKSVSLSSPLEEWKNQILFFKDNYERKNMHNPIVDTGYDVNETSEWIQNFYIRKC